MQGHIGVTRINWKHAAILLATSLLFQSVALLSGAQDRPKRPRITGIDHVRLYATNIAKSREFYEKTLGLYSVSGRCGGSVRSCFALGFQRVEFESLPPPAPNNQLAQVAFATNVIGGLHRYLSAQGLEVSAT